MLALAVWATGTHPQPPTPDLPYTGPVDGITCDAAGGTPALQFNLHLDIVIEGKAMSVPSGTGSYNIGGQQCRYWLNTTDATGIVRVASPSKRQFTLGNFFDIWGLPLSGTDLAGHVAGAGESVRAWVNGAPYTGNPADIVLAPHDEIVLAYGPPWPTPPASYTFPKGQ